LKLHWFISIHTKLSGAVDTVLFSSFLKITLMKDTYFTRIYHHITFSTTVPTSQYSRSAMLVMLMTESYTAR